MAQAIVHTFILSFLVSSAINICGGQSLHIEVEPENCLCKCGQSMCDLVKYVKEMDKRVILLSRQIVELVTLRTVFDSAQLHHAIEHKEIRNIISQLSKQKKSNNYPTAESLIRLPENGVETSFSTMADEADKMPDNFITLIEKVNENFKEVKNLSSEITELHEENKILKKDMEKEKRVRRSLEEGLNQTQSWVLEINEKVNGKDTTNSSIDEVTEIVIARITEFDVLNKTSIENQLKKLEYTVKDVFKNETQLVQRLDSVENISTYTAGLLENGTLVDKVHDIASTVEILEKLQLQQSSVVSQLERQIDYVNGSLVETILFIETELSKINDTWNKKSIGIDKAFSNTDEKIIELNNEVGSAINVTKDIEVFLKSVHLDQINNASAIRKEIEETQMKLLQLVQLSDELTDMKNILNLTIDKTEFYELRHNITEESHVLWNKTFAVVFNMSEIINSTAEKIAEMENKQVDENNRIERYFNKQAHQAKEKMEDLRTEFRNLNISHSEAFSLLESRVENLSLKVDEHNVSVNLLELNISKFLDVQLGTLEAMEKLLMGKIDSHKDETVHLINKLEATIKSSRQEIQPGKDGSSRERIGGEYTTAETIAKEDPAPCQNIPQTIDSELVTAYLDGAVYEELLEKSSIPHGEQLLFSCKKIGRYILVGRDTLTCINGQWSNKFPRCQKLLDESAIRDVILQHSDPCLEARGQFPDPSDCTKYYNCWDGQKIHQKCPNGLHFSASVRKCDFPKSANCNLQYQKGKLANLLDIIPPIHFVPYGVDVANSLLSTSVTGELVVHPGVTLSLVCLYPRDSEEKGEPHWDVLTKLPQPLMPPTWDVQDNTKLQEAYKLKLTISAATEDHSGNYTCTTPTGQSHTIRVLVRAVRCPDFDVDSSGNLTVSYRPSPEGLQKIMTTQALFSCPCGYSLNGSKNAICKASGTWSLRDLPTCHREEFDGCTKPDLHVRPGLYLDPNKCTYGVGDKAYFKCKDGSIPMGTTTTRCKDKEIWTVATTDLPECNKPSG